METGNEQHPEFFRVDPEKRLGIALVCRHVLPKDEEDNRKLPSDFISLLLETAIKLHYRQMERTNWWKKIMLGPVTGGGFTILGIILGVRLKSSGC